MACNGNCGSCGGCARELTLTQEEIDFLYRFAQIPFLPVARKMGDMEPVYLEADAPENASLLLQVLEKKGLISLDYDKPLGGESEKRYEAYPVRGSMSLTERGYNVLETLDYYGIPEEN